MIIVCMRSDFHPYECGGHCIHCRKAAEGGHVPAHCAFCWDDMLGKCAALEYLFIANFEPPRLLLQKGTASNA